MHLVTTILPLLIGASATIAEPPFGLRVGVDHGYGGSRGGGGSGSGSNTGSPAPPDPAFPFTDLCTDWRLEYLVAGGELSLWTQCAGATSQSSVISLLALDSSLVASKHGIKPAYPSWVPSPHLPRSTSTTSAADAANIANTRSQEHRPRQLLLHLPRLHAPQRRLRHGLQLHGQPGRRAADRRPSRVDHGRAGGAVLYRWCCLWYCAVVIHHLPRWRARTGEAVVHDHQRSQMYRVEERWAR